ncbi:MAG: class I SAM-dependent methyltransferase [Planctomycetes bacterium]|nr:class I SAM-dependent methyltransferase [Planctomycetota bacterium]
MTAIAVAEQTISTEAAAAHFGADYYGRPRFAKYLPYFTEPGTILDFGCNDGVFLHFLRVHGREGLGIDSNAAAVATCRRFGLNAIHADIFEFAEAAEHRGKFAGIMLADFVEHFDPFILQRFLKLCVALLVPGGTLAIITPNSRCLRMIMGGFHENEIEHHNLYAVNALERFLAIDGMEPVATGVDEDSKIPIWSRRPFSLARNLALWVLGRVLCGRECFHEHSYLVMKKSSSKRMN